jgi:hypothetical protein
MKPCHGHRALPDFLIIGAQKSATTSLLSYLGQHPGIKLPRKKATHYFDLNYSRDTAWYARHFPRAGGLSAKLFPWVAPSDRPWLTGESCPSYMFLAEVPGRVKATLPDVKIIVSLRDPVERLFSQFYHEHRKGRAAEGLENYIADSLQSEWPVSGSDIAKLRQRYAVPRGFYADQLKHWLDFFPKERFHLLRFDRLVKEPRTTLNQIFRFLDLPEYDVDTSEILNKGTKSDSNTVNQELLSNLQELYRRKNADLRKKFGTDFSW